MRKIADAFVLISTEAGKKEDVLGDLKKLSEIKEAYIVNGVYDLMIRVEAEDADSLRNFIRDKVRTMSGLISTITLPVAKPKDPDKKDNKKLNSEPKPVEIASEFAAKRLKDEVQARTQRIIKKAKP